MKGLQEVTEIIQLRDCGEKSMNGKKKYLARPQGTECSHPPKIHMLNPNSKCYGIGGGPLGSD